MNFTPEEYARRLAAIKAEMAARDLDVLVLSDPSNLYYACGYDAWSFYVPQAVLVAADADEPVWFGRAMDRAGAGITTRLSEEDRVSYADTFVQAADRHPFTELARLIRERGWRARRIGVEMNSYYLGAKAHAVLAEALPEAALVDASLLVNWIRVIKSPAEIGYMRQAAQLVEGAMQTALDRVRPGVRECDVAGAIYNALMAGSPDYGGDYASSPPLIPSGPRVGTPHLSWTERRYEPGDRMNLELVAARRRYHTPLGRSFVLGTASEGLKTLERATVEGIDLFLATVKPGMTTAEAEALWQGAAGRHGVNKAARCGYSIGIAYPPTFGEQTISLRGQDQTVLRPGMTLHLMPAIWRDSDSIVLTEPFVVTEHGCETLCEFPRQLFEIR